MSTETVKPLPPAFTHPYFIAGFALLMLAGLVEDSGRPAIKRWVRAAGYVPDPDRTPRLNHRGTELVPHDGFCRLRPGQNGALYVEAAIRRDGDQLVLQDRDGNPLPTAQLTRGESLR